MAIIKKIKELFGFIQRPFSRNFADVPKNRGLYFHSSGEPKTAKSGAGFTLIELVVAIFAFTLISVGLFSLMSFIFTTFRQQEGLLSDIDAARKAAFSIINELRDAQPAAGSYALEAAGDQTLIFYANADADPAIERVRYFIQNRELWKGVVQPSGSPPAYNTSTETTARILTNLDNSGSPIFYYYGGSFIASTTQAALSQPVNLTQVKFVQVNLRILKKAGVANTNSFTVTAGGAIRNLKTNLGQ